MKNSGKVRKANTAAILASNDVGVSFSLIACKNYGINWRHALQATTDLGFKRYRLMSYWSLIETQKGIYDFANLDEQIRMIASSHGRISLSIGMRQPRWPETHVPSWAKAMNTAELTQRYIDFHRAVIERYKDEPAIESWQLENEFWLRSFGENVDFSRTRLIKEFELLRKLTPDRPIIMTLARIVSLPLRRPTPDIYGTSIYLTIYNQSKKKYTKTWAAPWVYKIKKMLIKIVKRRDLIIHELQLEPWGPQANWEMSIAEQNKSMSVKRMEYAAEYAQSTGMSYIDVWGAEWWYWRSVIGEDDTISGALVELLKD